MEKQIAKILNNIINEKYPELDVKISIKSEPNMIYMTMANQKIYTVIFNLHPEDFNMYNYEGIDKPKWDEVRALIRDIIKMFGIFDKVRFLFYSREYPTLA